MQSPGRVSAAACGGDHGFYIEDGIVTLCPASCDLLNAAPDQRLKVKMLCIDEVF